MDDRQQQWIDSDDGWGPRGTGGPVPLRLCVAFSSSSSRERIFERNRLRLVNETQRDDEQLGISHPMSALPADELLPFASGSSYVRA